MVIIAWWANLTQREQTVDFWLPNNQPQNALVPPHLIILSLLLKINNAFLVETRFSDLMLYVNNFRYIEFAFININPDFPVCKAFTSCTFKSANFVCT
jgi:hypothetical protein